MLPSASVVLDQGRQLPALLRPARRLGTEMLVLSRKVGERIWIGDKICVTVVRIAQNGVRIGIEAPRQYAIVRGELDPDAISRLEQCEAREAREACEDSQVAVDSKPR